MNNLSTLKEYVKSSAVTFIAMFAVAVLASWDTTSFTKDGLFALGSVGVRAGVKGILEILALIKPTTSLSS